MKAKRHGIELLTLEELNGSLVGRGHFSIC